VAWNFMGCSVGLGLFFYENNLAEFASHVNNGMQVSDDIFCVDERALPWYARCMAHDTQIALRISQELLEKLDDLRRCERDIPVRTEMIRRLIERADKPEINADHGIRKSRKVE
jgi:hypothetical protein